MSTSTIPKKQGPATLSVNEKWQSDDYEVEPKSESLTNSKYKAIYDTYAGYFKPEHANIKELMRSSSYEFLKTHFTGFDVSKTDFDSVAAACVRLYTSQQYYGGKPFYKFVNHAIYHENELQLQRLMPLIRMITYYLTQDPTNQHSQPCVVYRGANLSAEKIKSFTPKQQLRFATILSTSTSPQVAANFASNSTLFVIEVPPFGQAPHYRSVKSVSVFAGEDEIVFVPYSKFEVVSCDTTMQLQGKSYNVVKLRALDNANSNNPKLDNPVPYTGAVKKKQGPMTFTA